MPILQSLDKPDDAARKPGRFQAIIDTVIGNLQLVISNIHIRYEVCQQNELSCNPNLYSHAVIASIIAPDCNHMLA